MGQEPAAEKETKAAADDKDDEKQHETTSEYILCVPCHSKEQYPKEDAVDSEKTPAMHFEERSLTKDYWEKVDKNLKVHSENSQQVTKPSVLSPQDQQKLLKMVLKDGVDAWKAAAE